jgi:hypothetical protein
VLFLPAFFLVVDPLLCPKITTYLSVATMLEKAEVKALLASFGWKGHTVIDWGDISNARGTEQLLPIWIRLYGTLKTGRFNFRIVTA